MKIIQIAATEVKPPQTVIIGPANLLREYLRLRAAGWKTIWTGEGKIAMQKPARRNK